MKRLMTLSISMIAITVIVAIGASAASAGSGYIYLGSGTPCDVTFDNTGAPNDPNLVNITIDNMVEDSLDPGCAGIAFQNPATSFGITFAGTGLLSGSGTIRLATTIGVTCVYDATSYTGTNSANTAIINVVFNKVSGSFLCPNPLGAAGYISVTSF
ncbi:MAG TPA: hypothetical protein VMF31_03850 [Solirubrobacterales bacterium]|nr:hypothetical protein [Solirubrobacterales bacterium]